MKYLRVRVNERGEVLVSAPPRASARVIADFVKSNESKIEQALRDIVAQRRDILPDTIRLQAIAKTYSVRYIEGGAPAAGITETGNEIRVNVAGASTEELTQLLKDWFSDAARLHLVPWLKQESRGLEMAFKSVTIRGQKTRWGSCSAHGTISLNRNLLFLPSHLVRYVIIHELCHLERMDHSPGFWKLVERYVPETAAFRKEIRRASELVPSWAR